jgi:mono/diheme cytochrome c family protein
MRSAALTLSVLLLGACHSPSGGIDREVEAPLDGSVAIRDRALLESGAGLYLKYCASCHGVTARGNGPVAGSLRKPPADLTQLARRYGQPLPKERLAAFIDGREALAAHGSREMPVWGETLYAGERPDTPARDAARSGTIRLILEYLETRQDTVAPSTPQ